MDLFLEKWSVIVPVVVDGRRHRINKRKLHIYTKDGKYYARAGLHGNMVLLTSDGDTFRAPPISVKSVKPMTLGEVMTLFQKGPKP